MDQNSGGSAGTGQISIDMWVFLFDRSQSLDQIMLYGNVRKVSLFLRVPLSEYSASPGVDSFIYLASCWAFIQPNKSKLPFYGQLKRGYKNNGLLFDKTKVKVI